MSVIQQTIVKKQQKWYQTYLSSKINNKKQNQTISDCCLKNVEKIISILFVLYLVILIVNQISCKRSFQILSLPLYQSKNSDISTINPTINKQDQRKYLTQHSTPTDQSLTNTLPNTNIQQQSTKNQQKLQNGVNSQKNIKIKQNALITNDENNIINDDNTFTFTPIMHNKQILSQNIENKIITYTKQQLLNRQILKELKQQPQHGFYLHFLQQNKKIQKQLNKKDQVINAKLNKKYNGYFTFTQKHQMCVILTIKNSIHSQNINIKNSINSIINQNHNNVKLNIVDRASQDGTLQAVRNYLKQNNLQNKVKLIQSKQTSQVASVYTAILKNCNKDDIIVLLDSNSQLLSKQALKLTDYQYSNTDLSLIYSSQYQLSNEQKTQIKLKLAQPYEQSDKFMILFRQLPQKYGNFFTFKFSLFNKIVATQLKDNNLNWFQHSGLQSMTNQLLQISCWKNGIIQQPLVFNEINKHQTSKQYNLQKKIILRKRKYDTC